MRSSDWRSDVCSSDLPEGRHHLDAGFAGEAAREADRIGRGHDPGGQSRRRHDLRHRAVDQQPAIGDVAALVTAPGLVHVVITDELRVGKACVSTCNTRWSAYQSTQTTPSQGKI